MAKKRYESRKTYRALGLRVRELRNRNGWTLEECEEHGWVNWRHLQQIESGKNVTLSSLINLANLLNVTLCDLLDE